MLSLRDRTQARSIAPIFEILEQKTFLRFLDFEQKRTERTQRRFALMLLESEDRFDGGAPPVVAQVSSALAACTRETDIVGWYGPGIIGIIFTEICSESAKTVANTLLDKLDIALSNAVPAEKADQIRLSCHVFPDDWDPENSQGAQLIRLKRGNKLGSSALSNIAKRAIDITGSLFALIILSPFLIAIAVAIKSTSRGPVLFRQKRSGHRGRCFTFLKFRSMYENNDSKIHQEYVKRLILGDKELENTEDGRRKVFKLTKDPRVTTVGRFLRQTSLDELPQFINVLKGDMSLVGPRPPIPYEVENYRIWHKRRVQEAKPGITGLWQVCGRSRTTFDQMVRMDLTYARTWSLWLDLKILLRTPFAVFTRDGAY